MPAYLRLIVPRSVWYGAQASIWQRLYESNVTVDMAEREQHLSVLNMREERHCEMR
jgi:hypothetical protein